MGLCMRRPRVKSSLEVLVLGGPAAGKTLLLRRLRELEDPPRLAKMAAIPTVGVEFITLDKECETFVLREVGSCLSSRWSLFYRNAAALLYVVDGFDETKAAEVRESLNAVLSDNHMRTLPVCVAFTKTDLDPETIQLRTIQSRMHLDEVGKRQQQKITVLAGSTLDFELAGKVMEWVDSLA